MATITRIPLGSRIYALAATVAALGTLTLVWWTQSDGIWCDYSGNTAFRNGVCPVNEPFTLWWTIVIVALVAALVAVTLFVRGRALNILTIVIPIGLVLAVFYVVVPLTLGGLLPQST